MAKLSMKIWTMYTLLGVILFMFASVGWVIYKSIQIDNQYENVAAAPAAEKAPLSSETPWEEIYPNTEPMKIRDINVKASVAKNWPDRIKGLSDTPYLPEDVVKVFVFDSSGYHSFWMKDMLYSIDIIWVDEESRIVHIEKEVAPESYPGMFVTETPATYVIETAAGFVAKNQIKVGEFVELPKL